MVNHLKIIEQTFLLFRIIISVEIYTICFEVLYKQMKEEVESTAVGFAVGICPDNDCPATE